MSFSAQPNEEGAGQVPPPSPGAWRGSRRREGNSAQLPLSSVAQPRSLTVNGAHELRVWVCPQLLVLPGDAGPRGSLWSVWGVQNTVTSSSLVTHEHVWESWGSWAPSPPLSFSLAGVCSHQQVTKEPGDDRMIQTCSKSNRSFH